MKTKDSFFPPQARRAMFAMVVFALLILLTAPASALANTSASFSKIDFVANIETIGVAVTGANLPKTAELMYRQNGENVWRNAHPLMRIDDGRLIGSLFGLSPSTSYEIQVRDGAALISGWAVTQAEALQFTPSLILRVDDNAAPGGDGISAPFQTIQEAVNRATPGTQVLVADGLYRETVTFPNSGAAGNWIQLKAEGSGAILDGANYLAGNIWTLLSGTKNVWQTKVASSVAYLARDQKRFYLYDNLSGLLRGVGHEYVPMSEGWYIDPNTLTLYVRSLTDPALSTWQVPFLNSGIEANGRDWLWIEGFEIRFYGTQYGCGVCVKNASHIVIRKNKIHNVQKGIFIEWTGGDDRGNDTRIEYNELYDPPVDSWQWKAVKATSMEGTAIILRGHIGAIVRGNDIHNYFNGIYTGSSGDMENSALAFDADIYNNYIHHVSDDALEPEGACINQRFRNNTIDTMLVGISLAPVTKGPVWALRSTYANYSGRSVKLDRKSDGIVLFYHNTSWTTQNANGADIISSVHNIVMRNNIFQSNGFAFREVTTGSSGNDWNNDNWYTKYSPRFKWENVSYNNMAKLCAGARLECGGYEHLPGLANPAAGNFALLSSSPNIDRGAFIRGINENFSGNAPDIGALEFGAPVLTPAPVDSPPAIFALARADANPSASASVNFTAVFSEPVNGVDATDFMITASNIVGAFVTGVAPVSEMIYSVNVSTGEGDGTIRLDIVDDDSIRDAAQNPLGGIGAGNGNFIAGETYTISKSPALPTPSDIPTTPIPSDIPPTSTPPVIPNALTFNSVGIQDGWILESGEFTNKGGAVDRISPVFNIGDDAQDKQYKSVVSFITDSLPDDAIILSAQLTIKRQGVVGAYPFDSHGVLLAEIRAGSFNGDIELVAEDFLAEASPGSAQDVFASLGADMYAANLNSANFALINKTGATQFRLFFSRDDDDDQSADYLKIFSGNAANVDQPQLTVTYLLP